MFTKSNYTERYRTINTFIFLLFSAGGAALHFRYDKVAAVLLLISFVVAVSMLPYTINNILNSLKDSSNKTTDFKPSIQCTISSILVIVAYIYYLMA